jgi:hypothetical protein
MKTERQTSKDQKLFHVSLHSTVSQNLSKNVGKPKVWGQAPKAPELINPTQTALH